MPQNAGLCDETLSTASKDFQFDHTPLTPDSIQRRLCSALIDRGTWLLPKAYSTVFWVCIEIVSKRQLQPTPDIIGLPLCDPWERFY